MPSRRTILKTGAAFLGAALPPGIWASTCTSQPLIVVYEPQVPESLRFMQALCGAALTAVPVGEDPAATHRSLVNHGSRATIVGCTRESTAFVLEKLTPREAMQFTALGQHRYQAANTLQHRLRLPMAAPVPADWAARWPETLAAAIGSRLPRPAATIAWRHLVTSTVRPPASPGYLVTWCLTGDSRGGAA